MTYKIVLTKRAVKDIEKLGEKTKRRILEELKENEEDPIARARKLINKKLGTYRYKIGDYRVIFDIEGNDVVILRIGHRKSIYK